MAICITNKNAYESLELAEEALIQNHIRNHHNKNRGPINVYLCNDCDNYHFTSKGEINQKLKDNKVQDRIKKEQQANYWERKLR